MLLFFLVLPGLIQNCKKDIKSSPTKETTRDTLPTVEEKIILPGAYQLDEYLPKLKDKRIALVVNQTSRIEEEHLVDVLLKHAVSIVKIFAPEHGFRGTADAGEKVADRKDLKTGIPLISLYGKNKKPNAKMLNGIDLIVFDIQDVGARFYTYISTMHYVMEACAENQIPFLILDRPNPNGHYVDGPVLEQKYHSFIGMHEVPVVHGMTIAEYARMINGEKWLANDLQCKLSYIPCRNYDHSQFYDLPIKPSPNLPNMKSIYLYPSICFFEGTTASEGRGTSFQFQVYGHPDFNGGNYSFTPQSMEGAKHPKHEGKLCKGFNLTKKTYDQLRREQFNLKYLIEFYEAFPNKSTFFKDNGSFDRLAGTDQLRMQIINGEPLESIKKSWEERLNHFNSIRQKYLLYPE